MDTVNPVARPGSETDNTTSMDGRRPGDHDMPYRFGLRPTAKAPFPFRELQYARLLILRGRVQDAPSAEDRLAA
jgi:hypothetical protein